MAVAFGKIYPFNPSQDDWPLYVERLGHVFVANGITEETKKQTVFLSVIGPSYYKLLSSLLAPDKPGDKEYNILVDKLSEHFTPAPSEIVERSKFHTRFCKPGESVTAFVSELRSIAKSCTISEIRLKPCSGTASSAGLMTVLFSVAYLQRKDYHSKLPWSSPKEWSRQLRMSENLMYPHGNYRLPPDPLLQHRIL